MWKCPNCGQVTARTKDWACQWCGYPLLSESYRRLPKTYRQLKEEKLFKQKVLFGQEPAPEEIEVSVKELYSACAVDKTAADARFRNNILRVTGIVDRIVVEEDYDIYYITLASGEEKEEWHVNCLFDKKRGLELKRLTTGQTVTVRGKYDGYEINILIKDCVLLH